MDLFKQMNLSTEENELDREQFHIISIMIISHLLNGRCLNVANDLHDLPCRSYFTSNLLGSDGLISFDGFKEVLESIGLGNESNHDDSEEAGDDHDHLRKRRDTSDNSGTSPTLNTRKHVSAEFTQCLLICYCSLSSCQTNLLKEEEEKCWTDALLIISLFLFYWLKYVRKLQHS